MRSLFWLALTLLSPASAHDFYDEDVPGLRYEDVDEQYYNDWEREEETQDNENNEPY